MAVTTTKTNKPLNPRGNDQSPKGYNRAALYSGKALDFDGVNDILTMPTVLTSSLSTTSVTFVTNVKSDFSSWTGDRDDAFSFAERGMILAFNNGLIYYYYRHQSSGWRNLSVPVEHFKTQEWNQMVTTIDLNADTWKAYINGIEVASSGTYSDTAIAYDSNALTIGAQAGARFFDGQISGFKIFNTALTAAQVSDLYNNPEKIVPTGVADSALKLWLPMMEGAGTTAYDGSGNGNHGTISGATWTHGVGSPVAQTAVIDWNKGSNLFPYSNDYSQSNWSKADLTIVANSAISPDGSNNASLLYVSSNSSASYLYDVLNESSAVYTISAFVKASGRSICWMYMQGSASNGVAYFDLSDQSTQVVAGSDSTLTATITSVGNDWYKISATSSASFPISSGSGIGICDAKGSLNATADGTNGILVYGLHLHSGSVGPYTPTLSTAQTSPVLLPQGLTSGRDITGVNLFENVRKQGALNLDGNSWAEVHDNASLDFTSGMSLECWVQIDDADGNQHILGKWDYANSGREYLLYYNSASNNFMAMFGHGTSRQSASFPITATGQWFHFVGTTDGSTITPYVNGVAGTTETQTTALAASDIPVTIGMENTHAVADSSTKGPIAQPRIYNRALTAEEVERNYNAGKNIYK